MTAKIKSAGRGQAPSATEQAIKSGRKEASATDSLGRLIVLRQPTIWEAFQLSKIIGADATNAAYSFEVRMLQHIKVLGDDDDVFFTNERQMKALVESLGYEGYNAAQKLYMEEFLPTQSMDVKSLKETISAIAADYIDNDALKDILRIVGDNFSVKEAEKDAIKNS